jgi:hypothetical protein
LLEEVIIEGIKAKEYFEALESPDKGDNKTEGTFIQKTGCNIASHNFGSLVPSETVSYTANTTRTFLATCDSIRERN